MHIKNAAELMAVINELYSHITRLERVAPELTGADAERLPGTVKNLRLHIIHLERLL
jgi:hypothetical protein